MKPNLTNLYQNYEEIEKQVTCAERLEEFIEFRKSTLAPKSLAIAHRSLIQFAIVCGYRPITAARVNEYLQKRFEKCSNPNSRKRDTDWLRMFLKWCEQMGHIGGNLSPMVPAVKVPVSRAVIFTPVEYETVKAAVKGTSWHYAMIMAYRTGARISDVCLMRWGNIDFDNLIVHYMPWKTRKMKRLATCPFQPGGDLHEVLIELRSASRDTDDESYIDPYLAMRYSQEHSENMTGHFNIEFVKICAKAGVRGVSFHKLRNSFMSRVVSGGASFAQATQLTGLSSEGVFLRYAKPNIESLRSAIVKINAQDEDAIPCSPPTSQEM